jgi:NAD(P)-dependent dehydrogenase (short-subunit alcohol dehydrogenase family)
MLSNSLSHLLAPFSLEGKIALVTGASSGLGYHFAQVLAQAGARVVLGARRIERLEQSRAAIMQAGGDAMVVELDVTNSENVSQAFSTVEKNWGCIDIVVNNAGTNSSTLFLDMSNSQWDAVLDTNLRGVMLVTRKAAQSMRQYGKSGTIINISSILSERTHLRSSHYCTSKAAAIQFSKSVAIELASDNIRVNAICPGYFSTEMTGAWLASGEADKMISEIPQQRVGQLDDLNGALLLLSSDAGKFMTGTSITVDGGHTVVGIQ